MSAPNVFDTDWEMELPEGHFRGRAARVGAAAGSRALGAAVYELGPGGMVSPYHRHHANEELLVVLEGTPSLQRPDGVRELVRGEVVAFLPGGEDAHRVFNASDADARVLLVSTMIYPEIAEHVTTGTTLALTGPAEGKALRASGEAPFMELFEEAVRADAGG